MTVPRCDSLKATYQVSLVAGRHRGGFGRGLSPGQYGRGRGYVTTRGRGRRGRRPFEGPQKVGKEGRKAGGPEGEQNTTYRPLGSALTINEVRLAFLGTSFGR